MEFNKLKIKKNMNKKKKKKEGGRARQESLEKNMCLIIIMVEKVMGFVSNNRNFSQTSKKKIKSFV